MDFVLQFDGAMVLLNGCRRRGWQEPNVVNRVREGHGLLVDLINEAVEKLLESIEIEHFPACRQGLEPSPDFQDGT